MNKIEITKEDLASAREMLANALCGIPVSKEVSFDPGEINYVIPRTFDSAVEAALESIMIVAARKYAATLVDRAIDEERRRISKAMRPVIDADDRVSVCGPH